MQKVTEEQKPIPIKFGAFLLGEKGLTAHHPTRCLSESEQVVLGRLVETLACRAVSPEECGETLDCNDPDSTGPLFKQCLHALVAGGYVQRVSDDPVRYRATEAGLDAAIGYGWLRLVE